MAKEHVRQHFIPQCCLRNFSENEKFVFIYSKTNKNKGYAQSIAKTTYRDYFYAIPEKHLNRNIKVVKGNSILTEPTLKLLKSSPNWRPGLNGGRQFNSYRTLRLDILIDKKENVKTIKYYTTSYFRDNG